MAQLPPARQSPRRRKNLWFERALALIATANLALVVFDLTYVSWRNFWLQGNVKIPLIGLQIHIPMPVVACPNRSLEKDQPPQTVSQTLLTCLYDPIKGIEPHRETQKYLNTVQSLEQQVTQKGLETGLKSPNVQETLASLRQFSGDLIDTNPFEAVGKSGTLEKIKNRMREHVNTTAKTDFSSREAFDFFWSTRYLTASNWQQEIDWFNRAIVPLVETNYYRSISENGEFTNNFWILDAPFVTLFFLEFLARTFYLSRRYTSLRWIDAMLWRWYDIPLFIPFSLTIPPLALLRVMPVLLRLHQAQIINLNEIQTQIRHGFVAEIAEEITEVVMVQAINQVQASLKSGELTEWLQRSGQQRYVDINNTNEIEAIAQRLVHLTLYQVFPKIQPDLEALLRHSIDNFLSQSPAYTGLKSLPGIGNMPAQLTERLVTDMTQLVYKSVKATVEDPTMVELSTRLVQSVTTAIVSEAQQQNTLPELQSLLSDLLEEIKINYVQRLAAEDVDLILEQTQQLRRLNSRR